VLPYSAAKSTTILSTACVRAGLVGRVGMDVRSRRVSSTHASRGMLSRRSDISSIGDRWGWEGATKFFGCWGSRVGFADLTVLVAVAFLGPCVTLGTDLTVLSFLLVAVTFTRLGVSVTHVGGVGGGWCRSFNNTASPDNVVPART
jgi:hypothetical protein